MPESTARLGYQIPVPSDGVQALRTSIAANAALSDSQVGITEGTISNRPASAVFGQEYLATDVSGGTLFKFYGSAWRKMFGTEIALANSSTTAKPNQTIVVTTAGITVTLPAPSSCDGGSVEVVCDPTAPITGSSPTTVSGGSAYIQGAGNLNRTSFVLGSPGSSAVFRADGSGGVWRVVSGVQDTGWVSMSPPANSAVTSGYYLPAARLVGNVVQLRGCVTFTASVIGPELSLPSEMIPASNCGVIAALFAGGNNGCSTIVFGQGASSPNSPGTILLDVGVSSGNQVSLDGVSFPLS